MAVWSKIPIIEQGEPLCEVPPELIGRQLPHAYTEQGADYDGLSPFMMREGAVERLIKAQANLNAYAPDHKLVIFDALRPIEVQKQMRRITAFNYAVRAGLDTTRMSDVKRAITHAAQYWANPTHDPTTPPPHSTGGAVDLYIVKPDGAMLDMGTAVDCDKKKSASHFFAEAVTARAVRLHENRMLIRVVMEEAGFKQNPNEWWHFDYGDQRWAYEMRRQGDDPGAVAFYGRATPNMKNRAPA